MIEIKKIDQKHKADINLKNQPFELYGKVEPSFEDGKWSYTVNKYEPDKVTQMCFPDENYDYDAMKDSIFLGAYEDEKCIGLAILDPGFFKYMYLNDLKVSSMYRGKNVGKMLMDAAKDIAAGQGYAGIYTICQDNNPGAYMFYMHCGFYIGGIDTNVYRHTSQEEKTDIILYCESK